MEYTQVSVRVDREHAERAEALLNLADPLALTFDDAADSPLFEPDRGTTPLWPQLVIHALFPGDFDNAALADVLRSALPDPARVETNRITAANWQAGLEQTVFVQRIAGNLCVVPADWQAEPPADNPVRLHMGLAFGTGRHSTTRLCLQWLAQHPPTGLRICDFGCGSGVLAIAALKLGATHAIAIDNDPQAITATGANARLNNVAEQLEAGELEDFPDLRADIVLANILAGTLSESAGRVAAMLAPGGRIVLSGILADQVANVEHAFADRFEAFETALEDGWARITARLR